MDDNPYRSPQTDGAASERVPVRGNPYSTAAIAYMVCATAFSLVIPILALALFGHFSSLVKASLSISAISFLSGLYALWKSWRPPPE